MKEFTEVEVLEAMIRFEGIEINEAKLTYARRQKLPSSAFCGPKRTYPAHDAAHVRSGLQRLSQFGGRLKPVVRATILSCLRRRAKRYKIEVSETVEGKLCLVRWDETLAEETRKKWQKTIAETLKWYETKNKPKK